MNEDFYELLGVSRDASAEDIKRAYRKAARKLHPDVNPSEDAADQMKKVSQAYETLSNPEKRRMYDMGGGTGGFGGFGGGGASFDFSDIFDMFTGGQGRAQGPIPRQRRGNDILRRVAVSLDDIVFGSEAEVDFRTAVACTRCSGSCCEPGTSPSRCSTCSGTGHVQRVTQSLLGQMVQMAPCSVCHGHGDVIENPCTECSGHGRVQQKRTITVTIPSGLENGTRIQLRGEGEVGEAAGPSGDLFVEIAIEDHDTFHRDGTNLIARITVSMVAAALGTTITLPTFDGDKEVQIRPGTQPGEIITLDGLGITQFRSDKRGDIHLDVDVEIPTKLSREQQDLLRQFADARDEPDVAEAPRNAANEPRTAGRKSRFSKLRDRLRDL
ncbi:J domain-containing protein [Helcobacillus sp. ACRRO]|uniref:molecular chaperone DnaJ n=1 Tax=Helcobacillus sp. ACRRO TaxID=2918202 RepID=UPI001EF49B4B|nr:J domain-containing protein [Helcobacillus sp. ACRRO]